VEIFGIIRDLFYTNLYIPFTAGGAFQTGCCWGLFWALLFGSAARFVLARTGPVRVFLGKHRHPLIAILAHLAGLKAAFLTSSYWLLRPVL
jgi:hypothetical protein